MICILNYMTKTQILGLGIIILSWIFWGFIIIIPFLKLDLQTKTIAITILLIASNIFWLGAILVGNEFLQKYQIWHRLMNWFGKYSSK
jgi:hypothetical protein